MGNVAQIDRLGARHIRAVRAGQCCAPSAMNRVCSARPANSLWHAHRPVRPQTSPTKYRSFSCCRASRKSRKNAYFWPCANKAPPHIALFHHAVLKNAPSGAFAPRIHRRHCEFTFYPCFPTFLIKFRYSSIFFPYFFLKISRKKLSFSYPTLPMISLTERSVSAKNLDAT